MASTGMWAKILEAKFVLRQRQTDPQTRAKRVGFFKFGSGRVRVLEKNFGFGYGSGSGISTAFLSIGY